MDLPGARTARRFDFSANRLIAGTLGVLVAAAALAGPGLAQAPSDPDEIFALFDVNKIQVISAFDANRNGRLERDEVRISDENFQAADRDGDGQISGYEFNESPFGKFEALDADGDGLVTREEFRAFVEGLRG